MDTVETIVEKVCKKYSFLTEDDKLLLLAVWKEQGLRLTDDQKVVFLEDCSSAETITRCRRDLVARGVISSSYESKQLRKKKAEAFRNKYKRQRELF